MQKPDPEELMEQWQEFSQDAVEDATVDAVEDFYQEVLRENLDSSFYLSKLPEKSREAMADMAAGIYGEQARRILNSGYVGEGELELAVASALLEDKRQVEIGAQAQGLVDLYWDNMDSEDQRYGKDQYQEWAFTALTDPWPPQHFDENWESVTRFKPPADDRTYQ